MTVTDRIASLEMELALTAIARDGRQRNRARDVCAFMAAAAQTQPHLGGYYSSGIWLRNGSRLYPDVGDHAEFSLPECQNPWDVVRYQLAAERIVSGAAQRMKSLDGSIADVMVFKNNVDYQTGATWGSHEAYSHRCSTEALPAQIIPHLVARIIFTGAGGFNPFSPGLEFTLSPRAWHLAHVVSPVTTAYRGIYNTKEENLTTKWKRLHLICGESLSSEIAAYLRVATTALVVAMAEGGLAPGDGVALAHPLAALRSFARDPTCKVQVLSKRGESLAALQIERHYLRLAEEHARDPFMPPWAEAACLHWRTMLDRLERGAPDSVAGTLDWAIKWSLYRRRCERRGIRWNGVAAEQGPALRPVRAELQEADARFGQITAGGIFAALDRAGAIAHHVPGVDDIERAVEHPPTAGRARLRGECVRQFAACGQRYAAEWQGVWDRKERRMLDLDDPFESVARWRQVEEVRA